MYQTIEPTPDLRVFRLLGDFDASAVVEHDLKTVFADLVENWDGDVEVDLSAVEFLDSSGIGAIVYLFKRLVTTSRRLYIGGASGQPLQLITMLRLQKSISLRLPAVVGQPALREPASRPAQ